MTRANEPAFPHRNHLGVHAGMTLREYYAGLAMQGILANCASAANGVTCPMLAAESLQYADALLAALAETEGKP